MRTLIAPLVAAFALAIGSASAPRTAHAAPKGGSVKGTIKKGSATRKHPIKSEGFVKRKPNPIAPVKDYAPFDEMVAVLLDGPVAEEDKVAPRLGAKWDLVGESFAHRLKPVQAGTAIEIKNRGRNKPQLYSPDSPDLIDPEPLSPGAVRSVRLKETFKAMRVRDKDSLHLEGRIIAFPHPYFSRVDSKGNFEIQGVPAGSWTLRIWFRDGWLEETQTLDVQVKRTTNARDVTLPDKLEPKAPSAASEAEKKGS